MTWRGSGVQRGQSHPAGSLKLDDAEGSQTLLELVQPSRAGRQRQHHLRLVLVEHERPEIVDQPPRSWASAPSTPAARRWRGYCHSVDSGAAQTRPPPRPPPTAGDSTTGRLGAVWSTTPPAKRLPSRSRSQSRCRASCSPARSPAVARCPRTPHERPRAATLRLRDHRGRRPSAPGAARSWSSRSRGGREARLLVPRPAGPSVAGRPASGCRRAQGPQPDARPVWGRAGRRRPHRPAIRPMRCPSGPHRLPIRFSGYSLFSLGFASHPLAVHVHPAQRPRGRRHHHRPGVDVRGRGQGMAMIVERLNRTFLNSAAASLGHSPRPPPSP